MLLCLAVFFIFSAQINASQLPGAVNNNSRSGVAPIVPKTKPKTVLSAIAENPHASAIIPSASYFEVHSKRECYSKLGIQKQQLKNAEHECPLASADEKESAEKAPTACIVFFDQHHNEISMTHKVEDSAEFDTACARLDPRAKPIATRVSPRECKNKCGDLIIDCYGTNRFADEVFLCSIMYGNFPFDPQLLQRIFSGLATIPKTIKIGKVIA